MTFIMLFSIAGMIVMAALGMRVDWSFLILLPVALFGDIAVVLIWTGLVKLWNRDWRRGWGWDEVDDDPEVDTPESGVRSMEFGLGRVEESSGGYGLESGRKISGADAITAAMGSPVVMLVRYGGISSAKLERIRQETERGVVVPSEVTTKKPYPRIASIDFDSETKSPIDPPGAACSSAELDEKRSEPLPSLPPIEAREVLDRLDRLETSEKAANRHCAQIAHLAHWGKRIDAIERRLSALPEIRSEVIKTRNDADRGRDLADRRHAILISHLQNIQLRIGPELVRAKFSTRALSSDDLGKAAFALTPETLADVMAEKERIENDRRRRAETAEQRDKLASTISPLGMEIARRELEYRRRSPSAFDRGGHCG